MQTNILECGTVRLVSFLPSDASILQELCRDNHPVRYTCPDPVCKSGSAVDAFLEEVADNQQKHGFSRWKAMTAEGDFIGWAGFSAFEETSEIKLGYCLAEHALEQDPDLPKNLCSSLADWFFENTYFSHLVATIRADNRDVHEVLDHAGFTFREARRIFGQACDIYQLLSPAMQSYVLKSA